MLEGDIREITSIPDKIMIFGNEEAERFNKETRCWIYNEKSTGDVKIARLEIIAILLVDIEELLIKYAISSIENLILRPWCFITSVGMIATYS